MSKTLIEMSGGEALANRLGESTLVLIDIQGEYERMLALPDAEPATKQAAILLERARALGIPVIHIQHMGSKEAIFDPDGPGGAFLAAVQPKPGEVVVTKNYPSSFAETNLQDRLLEIGREKLIVVGFMTHMCVSTTVRRALDFGYQTTVVAGACATRDLPDGNGGVIPAVEVHRAALAEIADAFATVVNSADDIAD